MQEQRDSVRDTYVPEQRNAADDDVAVGTAGAPTGAADPDDEGARETYPAGTYASGSAAADADRDPEELEARDDVEVVDRDRALAEESRDDSDDAVDAYETRDESDESHESDESDDAGEVRDEFDEDRAEDEEAARDETAQEETAREEEQEARGDADFVPADVAAGRDFEPAGEAAGRDFEPAGEAAGRDFEPAGEAADEARAGVAVEPDERDEVRTAQVEAAEDREWAAEHADVAAEAGVSEPGVSEPGVTDGAEDRAWAAEHATQLRAGAIDTPAEREAAADTALETPAEASREETAADGGVVAVDEVVAVPVPAGETKAEETEAEEEAAAEEAEEAREPAGDLLPGAVEAEPVGALWADGATDEVRSRWRELQLRFIDDPRGVAGEADQLVAEAVRSVTGALEAQRQRLTAWQGESTEDTERLRAAVRQYRDFLDRLLGL